MEARLNKYNVYLHSFGSLLPLFQESSEDLEGANGQNIGPRPILTCLSQSDKTTFTRFRNRKRGGVQAIEPLAVRFPIEFCPGLAV
jgi:hypothetical protein